MEISRRKALGLLAAGGSLAFYPAWLKNESMEILKRKIPSSGQTLPVIGLGTWQTFDVGNSENERNPLKEVLKILVGKGGAVVDSSPMYGRSERVVGDLAETLKIHSKLFKATKVWTDGRSAGIRQMESSMQKMKTQTMDLMQVHNLVDWQTHLKTLKDWKTEGKVRYIGITHYVEGAYDRMERIMRTEPIDFIQLNYSMSSRTAENSILPLAKDKGIAVLINRPYEGGSLFRRIKGKALPEWTKEFDCQSWGQFFLKYLLGNPAVSCLIPGTSKPKHMLDNIGAGFGRLPDEKMRKKMVEFLF